MSDAKRIILSRRAYFVSAALFGIAGCSQPASTSKQPATSAPSADLVIPPIPASAIAKQKDSQPEKEIMADADHDGIPDGEDGCPDTSGPPNEDPRKHGCPQAVVSVCLSIIMPPKIVFAPLGTKPDASSKQMLDETARTLTANPNTKLEIEGHTDNLESAALGQVRADAVRAELIKRGVDGSRLTTTNAGSSKPIAPNVTVQGRAQNRRIELITH